MATLGTLIIELQADLGRLRSDMGKAVQVVDGAFSKIRSAAAAVGGVLGGLTAGLSVAALAESVRGVVDLADGLNKASQKTGVAVEQLSAYQYAAKLSDVSNESLNAGITKLGKSMSAAASGSKDAATAFRSIGVEVKNSDGTLRSTGDVFADVARKLAVLPDGATKTAVAMTLMGKSAAELIPLINSGADGFKAVTEEAKLFGQVISKDLAQQSEALNDNMTRLRTATSALGISIAEKIVPGLAQFTTELVKLQAEAKNTTPFLERLGLAILNTAEDTDQQKLNTLLEEDLRLRKAIAEQQKRIATGSGGALDKFLVGRDIEKLATLQRQIQGLRTIIPDAGAPAKPDGPSAAEKQANEERTRAIIDGQKAAEAAAKAAEQLTKKQNEAIAQLSVRLQMEGQATEEAKVRAETEVGQYRDFQPRAKQRLIDLAQEVDRKKELVQADEDLLAYELKIDAAAQAAILKRRDDRKTLLDGLKTPQETYVDSINNLLNNGIDGEKLQLGIDRARRAMISAQEAGKDTINVARELGLTFTSSFEEAITGAKSFKDVLAGLAQDISKLLIRKSVTEPLFNLLGGTPGTNTSPAVPGLFEKVGGFIGTWFSGLNLFGNARGGLYKVGGSSGEHPVAFSARAGEVVAVGTGMEGGGGVVVNVHNYGPQQDIKTRTDGRTVDVFIGGSLAKTMSSGRGRPLGLTPSLVTR